jgi:hypothetical protein
MSDAATFGVTVWEQCQRPSPHYDVRFRTAGPRMRMTWLARYLSNRSGGGDSSLPLHLAPKLPFLHRPLSDFILQFAKDRFEQGAGHHEPAVICAIETFEATSRIDIDRPFGLLAFLVHRQRFSKRKTASRDHAPDGPTWRLLAFQDPTKPSPAKPSSIIAQVEGSGTTDVAAAGV